MDAHHKYAQSINKDEMQILFMIHLHIHVQNIYNINVVVKLTWSILVKLESVSAVEFVWRLFLLWQTTPVCETHITPTTINSKSYPKFLPQCIPWSSLDGRFKALLIFNDLKLNQHVAFFFWKRKEKRTEIRTGRRTVQRIFQMGDTYKIIFKYSSTNSKHPNRPSSISYSFLLSSHPNFPYRPLKYTEGPQTPVSGVLAPIHPLAGF